MSDKMHLGDGLKEVAISRINEGNIRILESLLQLLYDYFEGKVIELPQIIDRIKNEPKMIEEISALWSEHLFEKELIPKCYKGLSDESLIANLHQEGYRDGLYVAYLLAMMALVDNNVPEDIIYAIRDCMRPNLVGHHYDERDKFISAYNDDKYSWISK